VFCVFTPHPFQTGPFSGLANSPALRGTCLLARTRNRAARERLAGDEFGERSPFDARAAGGHREHRVRSHCRQDALGVIA
jgi:hypothetical protein